MNWKSVALCLVIVSGVCTPAFAAEGETQTNLVEKIAVRNRLFTVANRWEIGANFNFTLLTRLIEHYNLNLAGAYNIADWFAVELQAGYAISRQNSLAADISSKFLSMNKTEPITDLSDMWEMTGNVLVGARFQPIYGKISVLAEFPVHFQLYLWAGAGVGFFKRTSALICAQPKPACAAYAKSPNGDSPFLAENKVGPLFSIALGFRFFIYKGHSVRLELRDYSFLDSYRQNVTPASATAAASEGEASPNASLTNTVQLNVGYTFLF